MFLRRHPVVTRCRLLYTQAALRSYRSASENTHAPTSRMKTLLATQALAVPSSPTLHEGADVWVQAPIDAPRVRGPALARAAPVREGWSAQPPPRLQVS